jgi:hypothetical protein
MAPPPLIDGSAIIEQHPHVAFDKIIQQGYQITYRLEQEISVFQELVVSVVFEGKQVGYADFSNDGMFAHCQNVQVANRHKRRGIGTAMYVFAEKVFGRPLSPLWEGNENSAEAKALWSQPNRPFGNRGEPRP